MPEISQQDKQKLILIFASFVVGGIVYITTIASFPWAAWLAFIIVVLLPLAIFPRAWRYYLASFIGGGIGGAALPAILWMLAEPSSAGGLLYLYFMLPAIPVGASLGIAAGLFITGMRDFQQLERTKRKRHLKMSISQYDEYTH